MSREKRIIDFNEAIDCKKLNEIIELFAEKYDFLAVNSIGRSIFDRAIPIVKLGEGKTKVIYVGAHHGSEWITSAVLLRFINEYCELYKSSGRVGSLYVENLFQRAEIHIIPMLNPDGVDLSVNGLDYNNIMYERLLAMNSNSTDFKKWNANGRGVDLNHNYNFGFSEYKKIESEQGIHNGAPTRFSGEYPESEPEVGYLCNYLRFYGDFCGAITLHSQGEEIYYKSGEYCPDESERIAEYFSRLSGYAPRTPEGMAAFGGFTDWFISEFDRPSFTFECGVGENPLPISDLPMIYLKLRKVLFEAPLILGRIRR